MAKHTVVKPILHDGKLYRKNEKIELSADEAKPLVALGHAAIPAANTDDKKTTK